MGKLALESLAFKGLNYLACPAAIAGLTSSVLFTSSKLPMLLKAYRTRDLKSYSLGHLMHGNTGNAIYWL